MSVIRRFLDWLFPWDYFEFSTRPGFCGSHFEEFRRHNKTGEWQGKYWAGSLCPADWITIDDFTDEDGAFRKQLEDLRSEYYID